MLLKTTKTASTGKPRKPHKDFPLTPHPSGRWCKKIRGRLFYFGPWADPNAALAKWLDQKDDLLAGRTPRVSSDGLTVRVLCNRFLTVKQSQVDTREITGRHFDDLHRACELIVSALGRTRLVVDLASEDFEKFRADLAKTRKAFALGGDIQRIRSVFKYGYEAGLIDKPVRYGPAFKRPGKAMLRRERADKGERLFEADHLRKIIDAAGPVLRAMTLLAINGGLGNSDCGNLQFRHLDLDGGWLNFPRPKTGVERRCPLWPETVTALREALAKRATLKDEADAVYVFITRYGRAWAKDKMENPLSAEFRKLLVSLDLYRPGISFYTLRHSFATIAGGSKDQVAVNAIMGHADASMAAVYREKIDDDRLKAVVNHVRQWLFGASKGTQGQVNERRRRPRSNGTKAEVTK
jgi:integrase